MFYGIGAFIYTFCEIVAFKLFTYSYHVHESFEGKVCGFCGYMKTMKVLIQTG